MRNLITQLLSMVKDAFAACNSLIGKNSGDRKGALIKVVSTLISAMRYSFGMLYRRGGSGFSKGVTAI